jgi:hypothetical protein
MHRLRNSLIAALTAPALLAGCEAAPATATSGAAETPAPRATLGLLTGLPLYLPLGADIGAIASGTASVPWQRQALERDYVLEPLDTLAPIPALSPRGAASDPLAGLTRLAVIQPRALSPADNVALDGWVRGGGHLLLVLDPMLTGEYDLPLGDPRRPSDGALIPPVVARWGMAVRFDEAQSADATTRTLAGAVLPLVLAGEVTLEGPAAPDCTRMAEGAAATCRVGKGRVTLIADAAVFEHPELAGEGGATLRAAVRAGLE